jgi:tryptophan-rich sensory protein
MKKRAFKIRLNWNILISCLVIVYFTAFVGSLMTMNTVDSLWYQSIRPSITPPSFVFPLVWNILFFLIFVSMYISLTSAKKEKIVLKLKIVSVINLLLNMSWSFFFFFLRKPGLAFFELILLWFSIIAMIYVFYKVNKKSAWLLVPYLLWVSFAGILNYLSAFG